eukprot:9687232-Lingulodinium_polyedra.AAC.1
MGHQTNASPQNWPDIFTDGANADKHNPTRNGVAQRTLWRHATSVLCDACRIVFPTPQMTPAIL